MFFFTQFVFSGILAAEHTPLDWLAVETLGERRRGPLPCLTDHARLSINEGTPEFVHVCPDDTTEMWGYHYEMICQCVHSDTRRHFEGQDESTIGEDNTFCSDQYTNIGWSKDWHHTNQIICERRRVGDGECMKIRGLKKTAPQETYCALDEVCGSHLRLPYARIGELCRKRKCWCESNRDLTNNKIICEDTADITNKAYRAQRETYCATNEFCDAKSDDGFFDFPEGGFNEANCEFGECHGDWSHACHRVTEDLSQLVNPEEIQEPECDVPDFYPHLYVPDGDANFKPATEGKHCPLNEDGVTYDCINNNVGYHELSTAWFICANTKECGFVMGPYHVAKFDEDTSPIQFNQAGSTPEMKARAEYVQHHKGRYFLRRMTDPPAPEQKGYPFNWCIDAHGRKENVIRPYDQCNGGDLPGHNGEAVCPPYTTCYYQSAWYAQCQPGECPEGWICDKPVMDTSEVAPENCPNAVWGRCGGTGFTGNSCCYTGLYCKEYGEHWSQCEPIQ